MSISVLMTLTPMVATQQVQEVLDRQAGDAGSVSWISV